MKLTLTAEVLASARQKLTSESSIRPTRKKSTPSARLPGERHPSRQLTPPQYLGPRGKITSSREYEVSRGDRLGRSLSHLIAIVGELKDKQVAFRSLTEGMDTTTPAGELLFHVFGSLAQYERAVTQERIRAGLAAARRRGRIDGRPPAIAAEKLDTILAALRAGTSKAAVCGNFAVKRSTLIDILVRVGWPESA